MVIFIVEKPVEFQFHHARTISRFHTLVAVILFPFDFPKVSFPYQASTTSASTCLVLFPLMIRRFVTRPLILLSLFRLSLLSSVLSSHIDTRVTMAAQIRTFRFLGRPPIVYVSFVVVHINGASLLNRSMRTRLVTVVIFGFLVIGWVGR